MGEERWGSKGGVKNGAQVPDLGIPTEGDSIHGERRKLSLAWETVIQT